MWVPKYMLILLFCSFITLTVVNCIEIERERERERKRETERERERERCFLEHLGYVFECLQTVKNISELIRNKNGSY